MPEVTDSVETSVRAQLRDQSWPSGPVPTLWDSDGIVEALDASQGLLERAAPRWVQLHTWEPHPAVERLRRLLPTVRLVVGFGVDGIARRVALGEWSVSRGINTMRDLALRACSAGAECAVWNAEAAYKRPPNSVEAQRVEDLVTGGLATVAASCRTLRQGHTSYDHPTYHSSYPWRAWLGPGSPVEVTLPQVYAATGVEGVRAHRGALDAREVTSWRSFRDAVRRRMLELDDPRTDPVEGVAFRPYLQLHGVPCADTVRCAVRHRFVGLWALRSRSDPEGRLALLSLAELHRRGFWGDLAVERFQGSAGLEVDGLCGPETRAALGVSET